MFSKVLKFKEKQPIHVCDPVETANNNETTPTSHSATRSADADDEHSKTPSISMKRIFANLIPATTFQPLKMPFPEEEHYLLSSESYYYVNDKDLGSIVAFTLR